MVVREDEAVGSGQVGSDIVGRVEREGYSMALSSYVLGNLDREGRQIECCKRTHCYQRLPISLENQLQNVVSQ